MVHTDVLIFLVSLSGSRAHCCVPSPRVIGCCLKISTMLQWILCLFLFHCWRLAHSQCLAMVVKCTQLQASESLQPEGKQNCAMCILFVCVPVLAEVRSGNVVRPRYFDFLVTMLHLLHCVSYICWPVF